MVIIVMINVKYFVPVFCSSQEPVIIESTHIIVGRITKIAMFNIFKSPLGSSNLLQM